MERRDNKAVALGGFVRKLREAAGLTVRGLARASGVDATGISRLERGEYESPEPRTLARLAAALGVDVGDLYRMADYPQPTEQLPTFQPYLRARYDLTPDEIAQLAAHFDLINERHARDEGGRS